MGEAEALAHELRAEAASLRDTAALLEAAALAAERREHELAVTAAREAAAARAAACPVAPVGATVAGNRPSDRRADTPVGAR